MNTQMSLYQRSALTVLTLLLLGCLTTPPVMAETRYVKPSLVITMRQGKTNTSKLITTVPLGTPVELVRGDKNWAYVRLQNGVEGWVRNRYLSDTPILPPGTLNNEEDGKAGPMDIPMRLQELTEDNNRLKEEIVICTTDKATLADKYQTLKEDPEGILQVKTSLSDAQQQIKALQAQLATVQIENTVLKKNESIKWFITGSSVLLIGWLIGRLTSNSRKKKPSLL
jgi:SH3 domain protein